MIMCFFLFGLVPFSSERVVVAELFTNTGCGPCVGANAELTRLKSIYRNNLAIVRYHMSWPSNTDTFYTANPTENNARRRYYFNFNYVPHLVVDGDTVDESNGYSSGYEMRILNEISNPSPLDISLSVSYDTLSRTGTLHYKVKANDVIPQGNLRLRTVITESYVYYTGPNGDPVHHQAMRDMIPDTLGIQINISSPPDSTYGDIDFSISPNWNVDNCEIISFIQTDNIIQSSGIAKRPIYHGAKISFSPQIEKEEDSFFDYVGNLNGYIDPNETGAIIFLMVNYECRGDSLMITVYPDSNSSQYVDVISGVLFRDSILEGEEINNNSSPLTFALSDSTPQGFPIRLILKKEVKSRVTKIKITRFDTLTFIVGTPTIIFYDDFETGLTNWIIGGLNHVSLSSDEYHSPSNSALVGVFPPGPEPNGDDWMYKEITLPSDVDYVYLDCWVKRGTEDAITYDWQRLQILNSVGAILKTLYNTCANDNKWENLTFDISSYKGMTVRIRFLTHGDGYTDETWQYIDDVKLLTYKTVGIEEDIFEIKDIDNIILGDRKISIKVNRDIFLNISLFDISGRKVKEILNGYKKVEDCSFRLNVKNGIYFLRIMSDKVISTKKLVVIN